MYISIVTCQIAGTIIHDLDPMGLLETNGDEDGNVKGTSYLIKPYGNNLISLEVCGYKCQAI